MSIVAQHARLDSLQAENFSLSTIAYGEWFSIATSDDVWSPGPIRTT